MSYDQKRPEHKSTKRTVFEDDQAGYIKKRSSADATQVMVRIQEDVTDLKKRLTARGEDLD